MRYGSNVANNYRGGGGAIIESRGASDWFSARHWLMHVHFCETRYMKRVLYLYLC